MNHLPYTLLPNVPGDLPYMVVPGDYEGQPRAGLYDPVWVDTIEAAVSVARNDVIGEGGHPSAVVLLHYDATWYPFAVVRRITTSPVTPEDDPLLARLSEEALAANDRVLEHRERRLLAFR